MVTRGQAVNVLHTPQPGIPAADHILTTAACQYKGRPDDCRELQVLREFRDNIPLPTAEGRELVEHYYLIAPPIAEAIKEAQDFELIWSTVQQCIVAIEAKRYFDAVCLYKSMAEDLKKQLG